MADRLSHTEPGSSPRISPVSYLLLWCLQSRGARVVDMLGDTESHVLSMEGLHLHLHFLHLVCNSGSANGPVTRTLLMLPGPSPRSRN